MQRIQRVKRLFNFYACTGSGHQRRFSLSAKLRSDVSPSLTRRLSCQQAAGRAASPIAHQHPTSTLEVPPVAVFPAKVFAAPTSTCVAQCPASPAKRDPLSRNSLLRAPSTTATRVSTLVHRRCGRHARYRGNGYSSMFVALAAPTLRNAKRLREWWRWRQ